MIASPCVLLCCAARLHVHRQSRDFSNHPGFAFNVVLAIIVVLDAQILLEAIEFFPPLRMLPHEVAEGKVLAQLISALFADVEMVLGKAGLEVEVREIEGLPFGDAEISLMGVTQSFQTCFDFGKISGGSHNVDVDNWLRHHAGNGGAADVLDRTVDTGNGGFQKCLDLLEVRRPSGIVGLDEGYWHFFICLEFAASVTFQSNISRMGKSG